MGSGKTTALNKAIKHLREQGKPIVLLTTRIAVTNMYIDEHKTSEYDTFSTMRVNNKRIYTYLNEDNEIEPEIMD